MTDRTFTPSRWLQAGDEPSLADLIDDPIADLLRQRDGIESRDVWRAVHLARWRLASGRRAA